MGSTFVQFKTACSVDRITGHLWQLTQSPSSAKAFGKVFSERMDVSSLKSQGSHMGLSGSIKYPFPVIIPEVAVSTESLRTCSKALDERNNVVHNAQGDVYGLGEFTLRERDSRRQNDGLVRSQQR